MAALVHDGAALARRLDDARGDGARVALVPTMGALHAGHLSLVRLAAQHADHVVVSIFVNPLQFAPGEDLERYPRTLEADAEALASAGVGTVWIPAVADLYPYGVGTGITVDPGALGSVLEGAARPTHFRGVLTVVAKLFGAASPDAAVFGEKDYQQLVLVRRMVRELRLGVEVVPGPLVREPDGLALSSRNRYLEPDDRATARCLSRSLQEGARAAAEGADAAGVEAAAGAVLDEASGVDTEYVALTDPDLGPPPVAGPARLLVAGRVGGTRLLDNVAIALQPSGDA